MQVRFIKSGKQTFALKQGGRKGIEKGGIKSIDHLEPKKAQKDFQIY